MLTGRTKYACQESARKKCREVGAEAAAELEQRVGRERDEKDDALLRQSVG